LLDRCRNIDVSSSSLSFTIFKDPQTIFLGTISTFDDASSQMSVLFSPDGDVISAFKGENLINPKVKVGIQWKFDISNDIVEGNRISIALPQESVNQVTQVPVSSTTELVMRPSRT
jgi:hypothetical protein